MLQWWRNWYHAFLENGKTPDPYTSFGNRNDDTMIERLRVMGDNIVEVHVDLFRKHVPNER